MTDRTRSAVAEPARPTLVLERTYRAELQELWELWTTKDGFESWWGPEGFEAKVHVLEARLLGALHYDMCAVTPEMVETMKQLGQPASHEARATFSEFRPLSRLALTHMIDFWPGVQPYENTCSAEFLPIGDKVRMVITLSPMHNEEMSRMQQQGMASQLTKLDKLFGRRS
jgi:uncharacterized protein YndB with AHSA1/START domain